MYLCKAYHRGGVWVGEPLTYSTAAALSRTGLAGSPPPKALLHANYQQVDLLLQYQLTNKHVLY